MPAKRSRRTNQQSTSGAFAGPAEQREIELAAPAAPVELPVTVDAATGKPAAPKAGPPIRGGGRSGGVGREQGARPARQYAFRRS
jgi:hypothetical protein